MNDFNVLLPVDSAQNLQLRINSGDQLQNIHKILLEHYGYFVVGSTIAYMCWFVYST